jgi:hypothetical protein
MKRTCLGCVVLAAFVIALGMSGCSTEDDGASGVDSWQGAEPHIEIAGTLNGEDLDVSITGADADDLARLFCTREYDAPEDTDGELIMEQAVPDDLSIQLLGVDINGEARDIQIEFKDHDFGADALGTVLQVVPRVEEVPAPGTLYVEWEWYLAGEFLADEDAYYEESAIQGTVEVNLFSGVVSDDGVTIPDNTGAVGIYADLSWSETENVQVSVTANCGENDL